MGHLNAWWSTRTARQEVQDFLHSPAGSTESKPSSSDNTVGIGSRKKGGDGRASSYKLHLQIARKTWVSHS